jgi:DNA-binding MarR family transcriptional regulator
MSEVREEIIGALNTKASSTAPLQEVQILHFLYPKPSSDQVTVTLMMNDWSGVSNAATCTVGATFSYTAPRGYPDYDAAWTAAGPTTADGAWNGDWDWSDYYPAGSAQSTSDTIFRIHPWGQAKILRDTIRPESARNLWDNQGLRADTDQEAAVLFGNRITFTAQGGGDSETNFVGTARDVGAIIGYTTVGVASAAGIAVLATEFARYKFFKLLFLIPGFSRLEKDEVLEHNKRDELYRFIKTTPGPSFSDLRRELGLSNGTLVHHLRILEAQEYVKPVRDGFRTRFYVRGPKIVPTSYLTRTQIQLLDAIGANPGLTQKELSLVLGLPRESVSYHTKQLAQTGKLEIKQDGKWRRYWPSPAAPTPAGPSA